MPPVLVQSDCQITHVEQGVKYGQKSAEGASRKGTGITATALLLWSLEHQQEIIIDNGNYQLLMASLGKAAAGCGNGRNSTAQQRWLLAVIHLAALFCFWLLSYEITGIHGGTTLA